jgi:hypothetical protein
MEFSGVMSHFQQYFSYIMAVSFIGGGSHQLAASHYQAVSHNVVSITPNQFCCIFELLNSSTCIGNIQ